MAEKQPDNLFSPQAALGLSTLAACIERYLAKKARQSADNSAPAPRTSEPSQPDVLLKTA